MSSTREAAKSFVPSHNSVALALRSDLRLRRRRGGGERMKRGLRIGLGIAGFLGVLAFVEVSAASADRFSGTFRGPHGQFSIHVGSPTYPVGSYAPYGYRVYERPRYGYGFDTPIHYCRPHRLRHSHWVPVRRYQRRWLIIERPSVYVERPYYEGRYDERPYYGDGRYDDRVYADDYRYDDRVYDDDRRYDDRKWRSKRHKHSRDCDHDDD